MGDHSDIFEKVFLIDSLFAMQQLFIFIFERAVAS